ncbi:hypothetical protein AB1Y20_014645 [Prymnesium parvum]|uniref:Uncharacterized protein n=1 Tax=Prymnesium parvum TaxID=97485 RepID=A0AB34IDX4_PRYPA
MRCGVEQAVLSLLLSLSPACAWTPRPLVRASGIALPGRVLTAPATRVPPSPMAREGREDEAAKRVESGKAAISSTLAGMVAALPFLLLGPGAFTTPEWEFQADGLAITLFLFGVVYRYAVRTDDNPMLRQGVVGAFVITRSWAIISPPATCSVVPLNCGAPLIYFSWDMIFQGTFAALETGVACSAAAFALEAAFTKGWIQRCE